MDKNNSKERLLQIFFKAIKGDNLYIKDLALAYDVSEKTISRDLNCIKAFLAENRDLVGFSELKYNSKEKAHNLSLDFFLSQKELFAVAKIILGSRSLSKKEVLGIMDKLKLLTSIEDRKLLNNIIQNEVHHYKEVKHNCNSLLDNLWMTIDTINKNLEITIEYLRIDGKNITRRIKPISILVSEYYFYLIAVHVETDTCYPIYYRIDRIKEIKVHKKNKGNYKIENNPLFNEGEIKNKVQFMFPGECQKVKFEFSGTSVQAILDRLPTANIIDKKDNVYIIEAEVYGNGIKMFLLSQGAWVKVLEPESLVKEMKWEAEKIMEIYKE